ncbi:MAG: recombinase family protein [Candidatus Peribacteraceae bacterium]|nr:recombinase family protein [Candidatus Peribacteraceae bacterium]
MSTATLPSIQTVHIDLSPPPITGTIRYVLYARKSSEDDERQALSIDSQVKAMLELAKKEGLEIAEVRRESHSAKASGARPVFKQLLADIRAGMFTGILTWAADRLSRNAGDLGTVVDLMDQGRLIEIRTHGQRFTNNPNEKFLLMILCSQAKLENDNRGINTKRGMKTRAEMGHRPCIPALGYALEKRPEDKKNRVIPDPIRGTFVRQAFEKVAYQHTSGRQLHKWMQEVGFTTKLGRTITLSMIYRMLRNPFYTGKFEYPVGSGNWYQGTYEPLVSQHLFEEVGKVLDLAPKKAWGTKEFAYTKMMICGGCGSGVTAEEKHKTLKDGSIKKYIYYVCCDSKTHTCREPSIREDVLLEQLLALIDTIDLDKAGMKKKLQEEVSRYERFSSGILGQTMGMKVPKVDVRAYAKYLLKDGKAEEKRELLNCLRNRLTLKNGTVTLQKEAEKTTGRK